MLYDDIHNCSKKEGASLMRILVRRIWPLCLSSALSGEIVETRGASDLSTTELAHPYFDVAGRFAAPYLACLSARPTVGAVRHRPPSSRSSTVPAAPGTACKAA